MTDRPTDDERWLAAARVCVAHAELERVRRVIVALGHRYAEQVEGSYGHVASSDGSALEDAVRRLGLAERSLSQAAAEYDARR